VVDGVLFQTSEWIVPVVAGKLFQTS
jgi:hypothetical protein